MIYVDTSFLVAFAIPGDALHVRAHAWAEVSGEPLLTTDFVLCEFVNLLSLPKDRARAHHIVAWLRSTSEVQILEATRRWFDAGLDLYADRPDKEWSLTDCISFVVMKSAAISLALTHDHHFEQAGFEALLRRDPPG